MVSSGGDDDDGYCCMLLLMAVLSEGDGWKASALIPAAAAAGLKNRRSGVAKKITYMALDGR